MKNISEEKLDFYRSLNIDTDSKYFRIHYRHGLLENIDEEFVKEVQGYYKKHYNKEIDPITHIAYANLTNEKEVKILPQEFFRKKFLKVFNDSYMNDMYRDKGLYDILFQTDQMVYNVIKCSRGHYYTKENEYLEINSAQQVLLNDSDEYIIKPSDTNNGIGIEKIKVKNNELILKNEAITLKDIEVDYGYNFVVQRVLKQHDVMSKPHPNSINTLRMATLRFNGKIHNLYTFARFGQDGEIKDNANVGGLVVGVKENGEFMDYGLLKYQTVQQHPTTKVNIKDFGKVPNYDEALKFVRELHQNVLLQDYVAWDICISETGKPIFIEANFYGSSWVNQVALKKPMLGNMTDDILKYIHQNETSENARNIESLAAKNSVRRRKLRRENRDLTDEINELNQINEQLKIKLEKRNEEIERLKSELEKNKASKNNIFNILKRK